MRISILALSFSALMLFSGCDEKRPFTDQEEENYPLIKQGLAAMEIKDYNKAESVFQEAINRNPYLARPYLDLATIYHQYKPDYIKAIYFYKRYIELRPESEKVELIQEQIQDVQGSLAEAILQQTGASGIMQDYGRLQKKAQQNEQQTRILKKQVNSLKQQLADLQIKLAKGGRSKTTSRSTVTHMPSSAKTPSTPPVTMPGNAGNSIYHVVEGDNLNKISRKVYGDSTKWPTIYQANRSSMRSENDIKVGQSLVIPKLDK